MSANGNASRIDIGAVLDQQAWSRLQKGYVTIVALAVMIDGFDNQILGLTIASLASEWGVGLDPFAGVLAMGIIGLSLGTAVGGWLGDRFGRKTILIASVLLFGGMTGATCFAENISQLAILRVLAGLGLGGAMPNATALLAEYTPARRQALAVTLGIACVPLGGMLGGYLAVQLMPAFGWRSLYAVGGIAAMAVAILLGTLVPESPRFLAGRPASWPKLARLLNRLLKEERYRSDARFMTSAYEARAPVKAIFSDEHRHKTFPLWLAFFANLLAVYLFFNWMPTVLSLMGVSASRVGIGSALYNFGSIVGALSSASLMQRFGARAIMTMLCCGAVTGGAIFSMLEDEASISILLFLMGACTAGLQIVLFAVVAGSYPTQMRTTGVGAALAVGRLGAIASSFFGALMLQMDPSGKQFFWLVSGSMAVVLIAVLKIPRSGAAA